MSKGQKRLADEMRSVAPDMLKPHCPYCNAVLDPPPKRKKKCPSCGNPIYLKARPGKRSKRLVTEDEAKAIEKEWAEYHAEQDLESKLELYGVTQKERSALIKKLGRTPSRGDLLWAFSNEKLQQAMKRSDWGTMRMIYFDQARQLFEEGKSHLRVLEESFRSELTEHRRSEIVTGVRVQTVNDDFVCDYCRNLQGRTFTLDQALDKMPLPGRECTNEVEEQPDRVGWCRCYYGVVLDTD